MRLLVLTEYYLDDTNANAHCARQIEKGLRNSGVIVDVICVGENIDHANNVYVVPQGKEEKAITKLGRLIEIIKKLRLLWNWPLESPEQASLMIRKAMELLQKNYYNGVVAIHKSYLSVFSILQIKKRISKLNTVLYLLDPIANDIDKHLGIRKWLFPLVRIREKKAYQKFDHIIAMKPNKNRNSQYANKIIYVDLPLIDKDELDKNRKNVHIRHDDVRIIYFGSIDSIYRSPYTMMETLGIVSKYIKIKVTMYIQDIRGDCINKIYKIAEKYEGVFYINNYIAQRELARKISESDVILIIGNAMSNMIPSKIFDAITSYKPIICFSKQSEDPIVEYLNKYGKALIIKESEDVLKSAKHIKKFLNQLSEITQHLSSDDIEKFFFLKTHQSILLQKSLKLVYIEK